MILSTKPGKYDGHIRLDSKGRTVEREEKRHLKTGLPDHRY